MGGGGWLWNVGGAYFFFFHSLMGKKKILQGPWPPQATMWLRPCVYLSISEFFFAGVEFFMWE